jgi:hypothetical protein
MDADRFDSMVQIVSARGSRRGILAALAGGLLAALAPPATAKRGKKPKRGKKRKGHHGGGPPHARRHCTHRCGGKCVSTCPDVMVRNLRTCECECPAGMNKCGQVCIGGDSCCPGEKTCGGGCIREEDCCTHTHKACPNGACLPKDAGICCPNVEAPCSTAPGGCCNTFAGEQCTDNGCCNEFLNQAVCGGQCVNIDTDENCAECGNACGWCETCKELGGGEIACVPPNPNPPACETCSNGKVVRGESCGNGCCEQGKCRVQNGQSCCLKVEDNRLICKAM